MHPSGIGRRSASHVITLCMRVPSWRCLDQGGAQNNVAAERPLASLLLSSQAEKRTEGIVELHDTGE